MRVLLLLLVLATPSLAETLPAPARYGADVDTLLARARAGRDAEALALTRSALERSPWDPLLWELRGDLALGQGQSREAVDAYRHALRLGYRTRTVVAEDLARAFARGGEKDSALAWLERSVAWGNEHRPELAQDSAFARLFTDPRFKATTGQLPARTLTRDQGLRYDLAYLVSEVKRMHYRYRAQALPKGFEIAVEELDRAIPQLADGQVLVAMQALLVRLGDGHTTLYPVSERFGPWKSLPVLTYFFADGTWVVDADSAHSQAIGRRVVSIDGTRVERAIERVSALIPRDNEMGIAWMGPLFLTMPEALVHAGVAKSNGEVTFELADRAGALTHVTVAAEVPRHQDVHVPRLAPSRAADAGPPPLWMRRMDEPYWFEPLEDSAIVYLQFNQVTNAPGERLRDFSARLMAYTDMHQTRDLVVDVRHNNGGNGNLNVALVRALIHFETARPGRRIWVLTGRGTFSAAQSFINDLERLTSATFAGEPSSSSPNFVGESTSLRLPWSGAIGSVSTRYHSFRDADERAWIPPRLPAPLSSADYFANRDPALAAVVAAARQRR